MTGAFSEFFYRLFGDLLGDRRAESIDANKFASTFFQLRTIGGNPNPLFIAAFDYDGNARIDSVSANRFAADFTQYALHPFQPAVNAPNAPTGLTASDGTGGIVLSWSAPATDATHLAATSYNIYRSTTKNGEGLTPNAMGVSGTIFTDTNVVSGVTYYYKVTAVNINGESLFSSEKSVRNAPSGLIATAQGGGAVTLSWLAPTGPTPLSYNVYASTTSGQEVLLANTGSNAVTYPVSGLTPGTTYYFTVTAVYGPGAESPPSNEEPVIPTLLDAPPQGDGELFAMPSDAAGVNAGLVGVCVADGSASESGTGWRFMVATQIGNVEGGRGESGSDANEVGRVLAEVLTEMSSEGDALVFEGPISWDERDLFFAEQTLAEE